MNRILNYCAAAFVIIVSIIVYCAIIADTLDAEGGEFSRRLLFSFCFFVISIASGYIAIFHVFLTGKESFKIKSETRLLKLKRERIRLEQELQEYPEEIKTTSTNIEKHVANLNEIKQPPQEVISEKSDIPVMAEDQNKISQSSIPNTPETLPKISGPKGIGGWLIIPAIGLIGAPTALFFSSIFIFNFGEHSSSITYITLSFNFALFIIYLYTAILFFTEKRKAVPMLIGLIVFMVILNAGMYFIPSQKEVHLEDVKSPLGAIIYAAIWIPYLLKSKRVKNTFVK